ncbi:recombinase family protein [Niabella defluvii]|nr:recombinase family protein [Niabella sp. I65]
MKRVFDEIEKQIYTPDQIRQMMVQEGRKMLSMQAFHVAIRNPLYCGKVFIPKFKDEEAHFVKGQHEPLISEAQFENVQAILDGRRKSVRTNVKLLSDAHLP